MKLPVVKSNKHFQVDKANARMVLIVAAACFVTVFSLVGSKTLLSQRSYQARVIAGKEKAKKQLVANVDAVNKLVTAYQAFVSTPENVIAGSSTGTGDRDGDNAKIILDALPSKYDFPALTTSLEKILTDKSFKIESITGVDEEISQSDTAASSSPQPVEMPFQVTVTGNYDSIQNLLGVFEHSIRPINITSISLSGENGSMRLGFNAKTYYQPEKTLNITKKAVR